MFNKHNIRISYSCTANIESIIKAHNHKIRNTKKQNKSYCNCDGSCEYPLKGDYCRSENFVYKATGISELVTRF